MKSRVFLSCGQRDDEERRVASAVARLLRARSFDVYVAVNVQTILEINHGIIEELKNSDCYLFVNFRRDRVRGGYRGSLFSNQEFAIAYAMGFERILVVNQKRIAREGMLGYIASNTEEFEELSECCAAVERAVDRAGWKPEYSRRLTAGPLRFSSKDTLIATPRFFGRFLYLDIQNNRPDIAALETTARLSEYGRPGHGMVPCAIRSPLKATGRNGFSHTIFPNSHEAFDILCVGWHSNPTAVTFAPPVSGAFVGPYPIDSKPQVFLNSALDLATIPPLEIDEGIWRLRYEIFAIGFPVLTAEIELDVTDFSDPQAKVFSQHTI